MLLQLKFKGDGMVRTNQGLLLEFMGFLGDGIGEVLWGVLGILCQGGQGSHGRGEQNACSPEAAIIL